MAAGLWCRDSARRRRRAGRHHAAEHLRRRVEGLHPRSEWERRGVVRLRQRWRRGCADRQRLDAAQHQTGRRSDGRAVPERRQGTLCRCDARRADSAHAAGEWGRASPTTTTTAFRTSTSPHSVRMCSCTTMATERSRMSRRGPGSEIRAGARTAPSAITIATATSISTWPITWRSASRPFRSAAPHPTASTWAST